LARYYDVNAPETQKLWAKSLWQDYYQSDPATNPVYGLSGKSHKSNAYVYIDEAKKGIGDRIRLTWLQKMGENAGALGNEIIEGNEGEIYTATDDVILDLWRIGGRFDDTDIVDQRVSFDALKELRANMSGLIKERRCASRANHMTGNTRQTDLRYTDNNTPYTPDDQHAYRCDATASVLGTPSDETITSVDFLDIGHIDDLKEIARSLPLPIAPFRVGDAEYYGLELHPAQLRRLRQSDTDWYSTMTNALQGGQATGHPFFTNALGKWGNVVLFENNFLPRGMNSSTSVAIDTVRRGVFFGAGACVTAVGRMNPKGDHLKWTANAWDAGDKHRVYAKLVSGTIAPRFDWNDGTSVKRSYGKIVVSSYAPVVSGLTALDYAQPNLS